MTAAYKQSTCGGHIQRILGLRGGYADRQKEHPRRPVFPSDRGKKFRRLDPRTDSRRKNGQFLLVATVEKATCVYGGGFSRSERNPS